MTTESSPLTSPKPSPGLLGWLGIPARLFVGGVFLWAAWEKIIPIKGPEIFATAIQAYKIPFPEYLVKVAAFAVPYTEAFAAVLLILGLWTRAAAAVIGAMLVLFIAVGISAILRGLKLECGCFGEGTLMCPRGLGWCHIGENSLMLACCLLVVACARPALAVDQLIRCKWEGVRRK
jgi:uncharacterized membrane protein YphA (DoxX/SURF4 family)